MSLDSIYGPFIEQRLRLMEQTKDPTLLEHFRAELKLVKSWGLVGEYPERPPSYSVALKDPPPNYVPKPITAYEGPPPGYKPGVAYQVKPPDISLTDPQPVKKGDFSVNSFGYATDRHTIRFGNTTNEPITVHVTVGNGQLLPRGVDANGNVTIKPGEYVELTFAPGSSANFRSTKGDGSVWNQGEIYFDEVNKVIWGNMSYIYGANSNMRIFSSSGQHSGYLGDLFTNVPIDARVGKWGIMAPFDRFHESNDPNNPNSATGGPNGAKNAGAAYLYSVLAEGEGYVHRGRPAEVSDYDDHSSLRFVGNLTVVF
jgi:hypothetical protein